MDMSGTSISTQVLIIGTGWTALTAAREMTDFGFSVLLIPEHEGEGPNRDSEPIARTSPAQEEDPRDELNRLSHRDDVRLLSKTRLTRCRGTIGDFTLSLESGDQAFEERVGAVVLATETRTVPLFGEYGLTKANNAVTLSRLEDMLASDTEDLKSSLSLKSTDQIAFLSGFAQEGNPLIQRRILNCLHELEEKGYRTCLYTRNLKVADEGLEELAKEDRKLGTIFFKLEDRPSIDPDGGGIQHFDPVLEREVHLQPALIVLEERILPNPGNSRLARILNIALEDGFLQEENIHRLSVYTNKRGVFTVGSARNILSPGQIRSDAANAALALKDEFQDLKDNLDGTKASIDEDKCCSCLTCYRLCPHGAISVEDKPFISPLTCQGCGLCASQCPQEAITVIDTRWEEVRQALSERLRARKEEAHTPRIIAYCCRNSAYEAGMAAHAFNRDLPSGLEIVDVPCAGSINQDMILSSLKDADGLLLLGCHSGACKSTHGNTYARYKSDRLGSLLEEVGLSRERIHFQTLADNMDVEFARYTREMEENLLRLGRNPLA